MFGLEILELMIVAAVVVICVYLIRSAYLRGIEIENNMRLARSRENTKRSIMEMKAMMSADVDAASLDSGPSGGMPDLMSILSDPTYGPIIKQVLGNLRQPAAESPKVT